MRKIMTLLSLSLASCGAVPPAAPYHPAHHNIPATMDGRRGVVWLCATQLREYLPAANAAPNAVPTWEEDHYIQDEQCPTVPID